MSLKQGWTLKLQPNLRAKVNDEFGAKTSTVFFRSEPTKKQEFRTFGKTNNMDFQGVRINNRLQNTPNN